MVSLPEATLTASTKTIGGHLFGIRRLLNAYSKLNANALSRLGWICLHLGDRRSAQRYALQGLQIDPYHSYCRNLKDRLDAED